MSRIRFDCGKIIKQQYFEKMIDHLCFTIDYGIYYTFLEQAEAIYNIAIIKYRISVS